MDEVTVSLELSPGDHDQRSLLPYSTWTLSDVVHGDQEWKVGVAAPALGRSIDAVEAVTGWREGIMAATTS
jgi:hypothetical protein